MENLNKGLIKYMAGYFTEEAKATIARDKIRNLGFKDAFIVAYCDGKRIPVFEARRLLAEKICLPVTDKDLLFHINPDNKELLAKASTEKQPEIVKENPLEITQVTPVEVKEGTLVSNSIQDLYFTVQIGVFNRYVEENFVKGLKPINTEELNPKTIRYSVGIFGEIESAKTQRLEAIQKGFTDAFVVAYYQGKRITIAKANELLQQGVQTVQIKETKEKADISTSEVNFVKELHENIQENQTTRLKTEPSQNIAIKKQNYITFVTDQTTLNLEFYWWLTYTFNSFKLIPTNNGLTIHGFCPASENDEITTIFQSLNFSDINILVK
jgi:hypothetical protein